MMLRFKTAFFFNVGDRVLSSTLGHLSHFPPSSLFVVERMSRVKEEDTITNVENAVFNLSIMDPLGFLFIDQRVFIGMITKFIKFIELNFSVITRCFDIKVCMLEGLVGFVLQFDRKMTCLPVHYMEYTRWVFCKLCGRPIEHHLVYPTRRHDFLPRFSQEYALNHDLTPQLAHLFVGDTRWRDGECTPT
ncbi:hypothetical protein Tco_0077381 [Tanacetum coccineum]